MMNMKQWVVFAAPKRAYRDGCAVRVMVLNAESKKVAMERFYPTFEKTCEYQLASAQQITGETFLSV